jgi:hypothetical protein
MFEGSWV